MYATNSSSSLGDSADPLVAALADWASDDPRFAAFVAANTTKIRKKIRSAGDDDTRASLRFELAVARALLRERRIALAYEPLGQGKRRGPDFGATFKTHTPCGVEATRLRSTHRLGDALAGKLAQLLPQQCNLIVLGSDDPLAPESLAQSMAQLKLRAERRDELLFERSGLRDAPEFFKHFGRLSALAVLPSAEGAAPAAVWHNPQARHPLPNDLRAAIERCLDAF